MQIQSTKQTVCSFFSGGGLMDYAFQEVFRIIWANEQNAYAGACYEHNIGNHIQIGDITRIPTEEIPTADIYIGGPPCQSFSTNGKGRGDKDERGQLVWKYLEIIKTKQPKAFLFENVKGLVTEHKMVFERVKALLTDCGYHVSAQIVNASDCGAPQHRERIIIVGIRTDLGTYFQFPEFARREKNTVRMAIADLPEPTPTTPRKKILGSFPNHVVTWTNPTPERIQSLLDFPRPNQRVGIRKLEWDKPAHTLAAHIAKDGREFLHPTEKRRITVRECLRIMGIPDTFVVPQTIPMSEQYKLTGNGVAYPMAKALALALEKQTRP